jgi:hypothetical protein
LISELGRESARARINRAQLNIKWADWWRGETDDVTKAELLELASMQLQMLDQAMQALSDKWDNEGQTKIEAGNAWIRWGNIYHCAQALGFKNLLAVFDLDDQGMLWARDAVFAHLLTSERNGLTVAVFSPQEIHLPPLSSYYISIQAEIQWSEEDLEAMAVWRYRAFFGRNVSPLRHFDAEQEGLNYLIRHSKLDGALNPRVFIQLWNHVFQSLATSERPIEEIKISQTALRQAIKKFSA